MCCWRVEGRYLKLFFLPFDETHNVACNDLCFHHPWLRSLVGTCLCDISQRKNVRCTVVCDLQCGTDRDESFGRYRTWRECRYEPRLRCLTYGYNLSLPLSKRSGRANDSHAQQHLPSTSSRSGVLLQLRLYRWEILLQERLHDLLKQAQSRALHIVSWRSCGGH